MSIKEDLRLAQELRLYCETLQRQNQSKSKERRTLQDYIDQLERQLNQQKTLNIQTQSKTTELWIALQKEKQETIRIKNQLDHQYFFQIMIHEELVNSLQGEKNKDLFIAHQNTQNQLAIKFKQELANFKDQIQRKLKIKHQNEVSQLKRAKDEQLSLILSQLDQTQEQLRVHKEKEYSLTIQLKKYQNQISFMNSLKLNHESQPSALNGKHNNLRNGLINPQFSQIHINQRPVKRDYEFTEQKKEFITKMKEMDNEMELKNIKIQELNLQIKHLQHSTIEMQQLLNYTKESMEQFQILEEQNKKYQQQIRVLEETNRILRSSAIQNLKQFRKDLDRSSD